METLLYWISGFLLNAVFGAVICAALDTKDQVFYKWYKRDKTGVGNFLVLTFWPVMVYFMIRYKLKDNPLG